MFGDFWGLCLGVSPYTPLISPHGDLDTGELAAVDDGIDSRSPTADANRSLAEEGADHKAIDDSSIDSSRGSSGFRDNSALRCQTNLFQGSKQLSLCRSSSRSDVSSETRVHWIQSHDDI